MSEPTPNIAQCDCDHVGSRPGVVFERTQVLANECIAPDVYVVTLVAPNIAATVQPGQFVHLRLPENPTEILRLPFSVYDVVEDIGAIEIMYQVLGNGTRHLSKLSLGASADLLGPIGNGWNPPENISRALLVSGGLGSAPITMIARTLAASGVSVDIVMGAPTSERLVARDRLSESGTISVATDDGSEGLHGFCTAISAEMLATGGYDYVATCGPQPMQRIVAAQAAEADVPCQVSLERLMACGIGACLSCVVSTKDGLRRACVDGPVFNAEEVCWDE